MYRTLPLIARHGNCFLFSLSVSVLLHNINRGPENYWQPNFLFLARHRAFGATMSNDAPESGFQHCGNAPVTKKISFHGLMFLAFWPCAASTSHQDGVEL